MWKKLGYPDIFLMDIAPIMTLMVITHPFVSEQITQSSADWPHGGLEKGWTLPGILWPITGKQTILTQEVRSQHVMETSGVF